MIAVDTNVLVYAHRADSQFHVPAAAALRMLAEGASTWAIPWPCVFEFFSVVTHPRIYSPPSTPDQALAQLDAWVAAPTMVLLGEPHGHWMAARRLIGESKVAGPAVHDARIAALCLTNGVTELISMDRDFSRFPGVPVRGLPTG